MEIFKGSPNTVSNTTVLDTTVSPTKDSISTKGSTAASFNATSFSTKPSLLKKIELLSIMKINQTFLSAYENASSSEYKSISGQIFTFVNFINFKNFSIFYSYS